MKLTHEERLEVINTITEKEYVSKDCYETIHTLKSVAELEVRAVNEHAEITGWNTELLYLKSVAKRKATLYTEVLELIYED